MKTASMEYIIKTISRTNILPIISECNTSCVFCSHRQNPHGIEVFRLPKLTMEDFAEIVDFLSPDSKIIIGESATRIIEGEPFLHRDIVQILQLIRKKYKKTPIQVTTNGILLNEHIIKQLEDIGNIEVNVSVNCINPEKRKQVLGIKNDVDISAVLGMLRGRIRFCGSCVSLPGLLAHYDIEEVVRALDENGAQVVRIFLPGYTSITNTCEDLYSIYCETYKLVNALKKLYRIPMLVEPSFIFDLESRIEGVVRGSPSFEAGILEGDIIVKIDGKKPATRVEAFNLAYRRCDPELTVLRNGNPVRFKLIKKEYTSPGFTVLYDIDPYAAIQVESAVLRHGAKKVIFMTSGLAVKIITKLFEESGFEFDYRVLEASNCFFGGTIKCAGLLTVQDILNCADAYLAENEKPDLIILPQVMFDHQGRDLIGRSIYELEEKLGIPVMMNALPQ